MSLEIGREYRGKAAADQRLGDGPMWADRPTQAMRPKGERMQPGTKVTAAYRDYRYTGIVLETYDYRAWSNTLAFPRALDATDEGATREHVAKVAQYMDEKVPVLWDFGYQDAEHTVPNHRVYWERLGNLEVVKP